MIRRDSLGSRGLGKGFKSWWTEGRDVHIDLRWGGADIDYIRASASELVSSKPDVILVYSVRVLNAMREATDQIPIVFIATSDPVGLGFARSLAHPGGNLTGFMLYEVSVAGKLVEMLKEMAPRLARMGLLFNPENISAEGYRGSIETAAKSLGVAPVWLPVRAAADIENAVSALVRESGRSAYYSRRMSLPSSTAT